MTSLATSFSRPEIELIEDSFRLFDSDHDGRITFDQFVTLIRSINRTCPLITLSAYFSEADSLKQSTIDFQTFVGVLVKIDSSVIDLAKRGREQQQLPAQQQGDLKGGAGDSKNSTAAAADPKNITDKDKDVLIHESMTKIAMDSFKILDRERTGLIGVKELKQRLATTGERLSMKEIERAFSEAGIPPNADAVTLAQFIRLMT